VDDPGKWEFVGKTTTDVSWRTYRTVQAYALDEGGLNSHLRFLIKNTFFQKANPTPPTPFFLVWRSPVFPSHHVIRTPAHSRFSNNHHPHRLSLSILPRTRRRRRRRGRSTVVRFPIDDPHRYRSTAPHRRTRVAESETVESGGDADWYWYWGVGVREWEWEWEDDAG